MKARTEQLRQRWQAYSPRERLLILFCGIALGAAVVYFGLCQPLMNMQHNSVQTLKRQQETLTWMRNEIEDKLIPVKVVTTDNVRQLVEQSAKEVSIPIADLQQQGKNLSFSVSSINIYQLKNWIREVNISSGAHLDKLTLVTVDKHNIVKANVKLSWERRA